ncbi:protein-L-isoaspartate O-methyltransferase [Phenylobacterium sp.]|uniref:protein-L-isoaspartate O-methyltransferase family protein n=1 Tax=Phenylobacterium sp. TaxID=1871053 RepID=UPI0025D6C22E|nr:protein-L-isoaspartate O-methyltransferase [Phenylobacterium sp.]MBX3485073.1 protein-L-isoaspartate O-methyltransferase [Phenylobacterium sp.]MCW5761001.1 protein-L-isoaspartate O-methyltransferase [Phenylobacterium sp.]
MADFAAARQNMVESQVRTQDVTDVRIHDAMRKLPRESFLPSGKAHLAYADIEAEYAPGRVLLKPRDVGKLVQALRPMPGERALAISAPYAAAVMEELGASVVRVEAGEALPAGSFDMIVCEGAVARAPEAWTGALATNGRLGVVERDGPVGQAVLYVRSPEGLGRRDLFDCFPPVLAGFEPDRGFAF